MIKRTYSKRALEVSARDSNGPVKRRCIESADAYTQPQILSSSPLRTPAIFSDENVPSSTPPSSPVVFSIISKPHLVNREHKDASSSTSKKLRLHGASANAKRLPAKQFRLVKPKKLTQMTLDLGQTIQRRCHSCGMEYRPSVSEDRKLHDKYHSQNIEGIPFRVTLPDQLRANNQDSKSKSIFVLQRATCSAGLRKSVQRILEVVETELGGVGIEEQRLWEQIEEPTVEQGDGEKARCDRYKIFLCLEKDKVIGVCLTERIFEAYAVLPAVSAITDDIPSAEGHQRDSAIISSEQSQSAKMGVSRIWVSKSSRREGVARKLLDTASQRFIYGLSIAKSQVAFSQPTESGARLARNWFGRESGWLVYPG